MRRGACLRFCLYLVGIPMTEFYIKGGAVYIYILYKYTRAFLYQIKKHSLIIEGGSDLSDFSATLQHLEYIQ